MSKFIDNLREEVSKKFEYIESLPNDDDSMVSEFFAWFFEKLDTEGCYLFADSDVPERIDSFHDICSGLHSTIDYDACVTFVSLYWPSGTAAGKLVRVHVVHGDVSSEYIDKKYPSLAYFKKEVHNDYRKFMRDFDRLQESNRNAPGII